MNANDKVRATKLKAIQNPERALETGYEIEGYLLYPISVGGFINVWRTMRNGVEIPGHFTSTQIEKIEGNLVYTKNSVWQIEIIQPAKHDYKLGDIKF
jgi:riboflavin synthase alpha subunit